MFKNLKRIKEKFLITFFVVFFVSFLYAENHNTKKGKTELKELKWVLAHEPSNVFRHAAEIFKKILEEESKGEMSVKIMTLEEYAGKGASSYTALRDLRQGKIQMTQTYTFALGRFEPKFYMLDMPFLFKNHDHAARVLDGSIGRRLMAGLEPNNFKGLAFTYSGGFRVIPTASKELRRVEDFKGLKVKTAPSPVTTEVYRALGAHSITLGSLDNGVKRTGKKEIDGVETTYVRYRPEYDSSISVINETHHTLFLTTIITNDQFYRGLSQKHQEALKKAALAAAQIERKTTIDDSLVLKKALKKRNIKVIEMSEKEKQRFQRAMDPIYKKFKPMFGPDLVDEIVKLGNT